MSKYDALFRDDATAPVPVHSVPQKYQALFDEAEPTVPDVSKSESFVRGGLQGATSNFGDELAAGIDTAVSKIPGVRNIAQLLHSDSLPAVDNPDLTYAQRRDAYRHANSQAEEANPLTYMGGNLAGAAVQQLALPQLKAGAAIKTLAARGAAEGAAAGLGGSTAEDVGGMAKDALVGGAAGAVTAAAVGKLLHNAVGGAPERETRDIATAVSEVDGVKAGAKPAKWVRAQAESIKDALNKPENAEIRAAMDTPKKAIPLAQERLSQLRAAVREPAMDELQGITGGPTAGKLIKPFRDELQKLESGGPGGRGVTNSEPMKNFLRSKIDDMESSWSRTVSPEEQVQHIADKVVPQGSPLRAQLAGRPVEEQQGLLAQLFEKDLSPHDAKVLSGPIKPIRIFDPAEQITEQEARAHLSGIQKAAKDTFGTLAQTPNAERYEQIKDLAQAVHNAHLDEAAARNPHAAAVVDQIRAYNKEASALLTFKESMEAIAAKQQANNTQGLAAQLGHLHSKAGWTGAGIAALMGHPAALAVPAIAKIGIPAAQAGMRGTNRILAQVAQKAQAGEPVAKLIAFGIQQGLPAGAAQYLATRAMSVVNAGSGEQPQ